MRAMVYHGNKDLRLESVPDPKPEPGEAVLKVDYCGICATDIEEYVYGPNFIPSDKPNPLTGKTLPVITGHEITGTVVEPGEGALDLKSGDRVAIHGMISCGTCWWCSSGATMQCESVGAVGFDKDGGLAEYLAWPNSQIVPLPDSVSSEEAALVEPSSVAHHAVDRGRVQPDETVAVLGAGTVGLLAMQMARTQAAQVIAIDRRRMSLDMAKDLGADAVISSEEGDVSDRLMELTEGRGPDVVIDSAGGNQTTENAVSWVRRGGRVVLVAIYTDKPTFDFNSLVATEKEVLGSLGYGQGDVEAVVKMLADGSLKTEPLITDRITLDEVIDVGFARMMAPTKDVFRILVGP